ncbi:hypothetical protein J6590_064702 [Homalodisca vitripennis]|nr:hypothetical protein J6590_064702 [Homalodisca vitripennis]
MELPRTQHEEVVALRVPPVPSLPPNHEDTSLHSQHQSLTLTISRGKAFLDFCFRIINTRSRQLANKQIRRFEIPKIIFGASEYIDMIVWSDLEVTEPPLTRHLTNQDLQRLLETENTDVVNVKTCPHGWVEGRARVGLEVQPPPRCESWVVPYELAKSCTI